MLLELLALAFALYGLRWTWLQPVDGWKWSQRAQAALYFSTLAVMIHEFGILQSHIPEAWRSLTLLIQVQCWALSRMIATSHFSDRTSVERSRRARGNWITGLERTADGFLLLALGLTAFRQSTIAQLAQVVGLAWISLVRMGELEWRPILKRSRRTSLFFYLSQFALAWAVIAQRMGFNDWREEAVGALFVTGALRLEFHQRTARLARATVRRIQKELQDLSTGLEKIQAFTNFLEDEWDVARVSVVHMREHHGLLLASAGPDALPPVHTLHPQKLGPLLRRMRKEGHVLWAPVAEELGSDLRSAGLKHSSLAYPLLRGSVAQAAICVMAEEGERIPPSRALMMERVLDALGSETLTIVDQCLAELERNQLRSIATTQGALAHSHLDPWGRLPILHTKESRLTVALELVPDASLRSLSGTALLSPILENWRVEAESVWLAVCRTFGMLEAGRMGTRILAVAPREPVSPLLEHLGAPQSVLLFAHFLGRELRHLSGTDAFQVLQVPPPRVAVAAAEFSFHTREHGDERTLSIISPDLGRLHAMLNTAVPGEVLVNTGDARLRTAIQDAEIFWPSGVGVTQSSTSEFLRSLGAARLDKKELRRLEISVVEILRSTHKKAA